MCRSATLILPPYMLMKDSKETFQAFCKSLNGMLEYPDAACYVP